MSPITTHVLDTALGSPAEGVPVVLHRVSESEAIEIGRGVTDTDGRLVSLLEKTHATAGTYRLTFDTSSYFAASERPAFYPRVEVLFEVTEAREHYHVPLLLSPFGYSTYRGS